MIRPSYFLAIIGICGTALFSGCGDSQTPKAAGENRGQASATTNPEKPPLSNVVNGGIQGSNQPGTNDPAGTSADAPDDPAAPKPLDIIRRMIKAYHDASSYADAGQVRIEVERTGQPAEEPQLVANSVALQRPNKLRVQCLDAMVVSDGKKLHASVGSVANQVLEADSPEKLQIQDLFAGDALVDSLTQGPAGLPLQLLLLLDDDPLPALVPGGSKLTLLPTDTYDGHICRRVKVDMPDGARVFWIDSESYVLRLLELPTDALRKQLEADGQVKRVKINVEFLGARFNEAPPDVAFQFEVPKDAKMVKRLLGPAPLPPSELLGQAIGEFNFTGLDGKAANRQSLAGKVAVLEFWFTGCGPCRQAFPQLNEVFQKYKQSDRVAFLAVSIDPAQADDQQILETAKQWGAEFPVVRDTAEFARKTFHVQGAPTLLVVGPDGTVQDHEVGLNPQVLTDLPATIDAVLAGKATWQAAKEREQSLADDYERKSQQAASTTVTPLPVAKIAPRDETKRLRLAKLWSTTELKSPGNFLIVPDAKDPAQQKIYVLDGSRSVVELDRGGKVVARHALEIPQEAAITFLRSAVDRAGKRYFAGSASGQQQLFLFDADWKLLVAYPPADSGPHAGIADVALADLEGKGTPMLAIGYFGAVGVQGVSLEGRRLWNERTTENIFRLAVSGAGSDGARALLCTSNAGAIVPMDAKGQLGTPLILPGMAVDTLAAEELEAGKTSLCGMGVNDGETPLAIGIGPRGEEQWRYVMPRGLYSTPIERLTTANVLSKNSPRQWLLAGADGSVHIIAGDGTPVDHFHYGKALNGLASVALPTESGAAGEPTPVLLIATAGTVDAWAISPDSDVADTPHGSR